MLKYLINRHIPLTQLLLIILIISGFYTGCTKFERFTGVLTIDAVEVNSTSATLIAEITDLSELSKDEYGFFYSLNSNPTQSDLKVNLGENMQTGIFNAKIAGLSPLTEYYFRAYVKEGNNYIVDVPKSFTTPQAPLPTMAAFEPLNITHNSAIFGGNIISGNGDSVTVSGICYGLEPYPTISNFNIENFNGTRTIKDTLRDLQSSTKYYTRTYGLNGSGVGYSDQYSFTTLSYTRPTVTSDSVNQIIDVQAMLYGNVTSQGEGPITQRGFCYSTNPNPTIYNDTVHCAIGVGEFNKLIKSLNANTLYFYRAFARNSGGVSYGESKSFTTKVPAVLASVTIHDPYVVNHTVINFSAEILNDGGGFVEAGICWVIAPTFYPLITHNKKAATKITKDTFTQGGVTYTRYNYSIDLFDLFPSTSYNFRAYVINSAGVAYSTVMSFFTPAETLAEAKSIKVSRVLASSANIVGQELPVMSFAPNTSYGICWNTTGNPTKSENISNAIFTTQKFFESTMKGLSPSTQYFIKPWITNRFGTAYGDEITFTTLSQSEVVTDYDGNEYSTVQIGNQTWLAQNLKSKHYSNGTAISEFTTYNNNQNLEEIFGVLYSQKAATNNSSVSGTQGACPTNWHIPTQQEWETLVTSIGNNTNAALHLKEQGDLHWLYTNDGTNSYGFGALGAGVYRNGEVLMPILESTYYWSSTPQYQNYACTIELSSAFGSIGLGTIDYEGVTTYISVRCIKTIQNR
jgi:uncharacterized protein (TIGR02145 family)